MDTCLRLLPAMHRFVGAFLPTPLILLTALVLAGLPLNATAIGEFDGVWLGLETATGAGQTLSGTTGTIVYQSDANTLHLLAAVDNRVLTLRRSGAGWVLSSPQTTQVLGVVVRMDRFDLQFQGLNRFTAQIGASARGIPVTGTADYRRHPCRAIPIPFASAPLSGTEDSLICFEVMVPTGAQALRITMRGGSGQSDLIAAYHKPDFPLAISDEFGNDENISLSSPLPGKWFLGVSGWLDFSGVTLNVSVDLPPAPTASFSARPSTGVAPLTVQFSDSSRGSITEWFWEFGDGQTSTARNPTHTYTEPGRYDVTLRVTGPGGTKSVNKAAAIRVNPAITLLPILDLLLDDTDLAP